VVVLVVELFVSTYVAFFFTAVSLIFLFGIKESVVGLCYFVIAATIAVIAWVMHLDRGRELSGLYELRREKRR
jgi:hypothetical protein